MTRITFAGQLTQAEFVRLQTLASPMNFRRIGWLLLVFITLALVSGGYRTVAADPLGQGPKLLFFLVPALSLIYGIPWAIRRQWRNSEMLSAPITGAADDSGVEWNSPFVQARYPWDRLQKSVQADDLILLYIAAYSALYFPRSFFADDASSQAFREAVRSRVRSRK